MTARILIVSWIASWIALLPRLAFAQPDAAKAEALFDKGRALMTAGRFAEACDAFDASQKAAPATSTLFNQADCREKNGQLASASRMFGEAERATHGAVDPVGKKLNKVATERVAALQARLSHVTIKIADEPDGLEIRRDATVVAAADLNRSVAIDGGTYTFVAHLGDRDVWSETVTVAIAGDDAIVEVKLPRTAPATAPAPELHAKLERRRGSKTGAVVATGGSVVLLGAALGFDLWGDSTYDDAKAMHSMDLWSSANDKRYAAEGLLAAGLGCAGVAVYLWLRDDREAPSHVVTPVAGPGTAGVQLQGTW